MEKYLEDQMSDDERKDWEEKMSEPITAVVLTDEEIEQLKKEGRL